MSDTPRITKLDADAARWEYAEKARRIRARLAATESEPDLEEMKEAEIAGLVDWIVTDCVEDMRARKVRVAPGARTMVGAILRRQLRKTGKFEWGDQLEEWLAARDWRTPVWRG